MTAARWSADGPPANTDDNDCPCRLIGLEQPCSKEEGPQTEISRCITPVLTRKDAKYVERLPVTVTLQVRALAASMRKGSWERLDRGGQNRVGL